MSDEPKTPRQKLLDAIDDGISESMKGKVASYLSALLASEEDRGDRFKAGVLELKQAQDEMRLIVDGMFKQ